MASRSSTSARPRISSSVRGSKSAIDGCLSGQEAGKYEGDDEAAGVVLVGGGETVARRGGVGEHEAGGPLGGAGGVALTGGRVEQGRSDGRGGGAEDGELG